jgi:undecaprenyl-diphosphatase
MNDLDLRLFRAVNQWPDDQAPFWLFLSKGTNATPVKIALGLLVLALLINNRTRLGGFVSASAWLFANIWTDVWKAAVPFKRPMAELPDVLTRGVGLGSEMGTASAHSANMMCVGVCFCYWFGWWGAPWVALAFLVGISRIYVGAHYPSQVLFGWILGALTALIVSKTADVAARAWKAKRNPSDPDPENPQELPPAAG